MERISSKQILFRANPLLKFLKCWVNDMVDKFDLEEKPSKIGIKCKQKNGKQPTQPCIKTRLDKGAKFAFNIFTRLIKVACQVLLVTQVIIISYVVFGRFVLSSTPAWGEESALLCMVWFSLLSSVLAFKEGRHLKVCIADFILPSKVIKYFDIFVFAGVIIFSIFLLITGIDITKLTAGNTMTGMRIKSSWLYLSVPVTGVMMLLIIIEKIYLRIVGGKE